MKGKGIPSQKIDTLAAAIVARLNGQELTTIQKDRLRAATDNAVVRDVMSDITKKKADGIDSVQNNGYDKTKGNENRHETVTEDAAPHQNRNAFSEGSYEGNRKTIIDSTPELEAHIKKVDPSVPRKRGIGGAHNSQEFFKNDVEIVTETPSKIPGVRTVEYRMPKLNADGTPTGEYGARVFKKTIYDPDVISDNDFMKRGLEAANNAISKADNGVMPREWSGVDSEGITWHGYYTDGEITSFFPDE